MKRVLKWALLLSIGAFLIDRALISSSRSRNGLCQCGGPLNVDPYEYFTSCTRCGKFQ